jgi:hypothetical protein
MELDKEFWLTFRAALIMLVRAIEKRYNLKRHEFSNDVQMPIGYNASVEKS